MRQLLRAFLVLTSIAFVLLAPAVCRGSGKVVLAVGSNSGLEHDELLSFGTNDALEFAALMIELGGVAPEDTHVLLNPTKAAFEAKLDELVRAVDKNTTLIFYYSGHGNETHLHIAGEAIDREQLKTRLAASAARLRLLFIDACRGIKERGFQVSHALTVNRSEYSGLVVIQSASRGEAAFESRRLQGGLFTRHLLSGLRGPADTNKDGRVSLDEAYSFAHLHTLADSGSTQIPDRELLISGSGTLELTTVIKTESTLMLPAESPARYTVFRKGVRPVFAEAWSLREDQMQIALPAGKFVIWRRIGEQSAMTEIETRREGTHQIAESHFRAISHEAMKRRGGAVDDTAHRLAVAAGFLVSPRIEGKSGVGETASVSYAWLPSPYSWAPSVGVSFHRESFDAAPNSVRRDSFQLFAGALSPALALGEVKLEATVGLTGALTLQKKISQVNRASEELNFERLGALLQLSMRVPVSSNLAWSLALAANPTVFREKEVAGATGAAATAPTDESATRLATSTLLWLTTGLVLWL